MRASQEMGAHAPHPPCICVSPPTSLLPPGRVWVAHTFTFRYVKQQCAFRAKSRCERTGHSIWRVIPRKSSERLFKSSVVPCPIASQTSSKLYHPRDSVLTRTHLYVHTPPRTHMIMLRVSQPQWPVRVTPWIRAMGV